MALRCSRGMDDESKLTAFCLFIGVLGLYLFIIYYILFIILFINYINSSLCRREMTGDID